MIHLANPAGLWALLALPVILVIHCLQERARHLRTSTLFLLERVAPESTSGATFERLRNSLPLWMQMIAACLIAWLLSEPRWVARDSTQTVVVVLDSTASMSASKEQAKDALVQTLAGWGRVAAHTRWHLLESDPRKPTLYAGDDRTQLLAALERWQPLRGVHDFNEAFAAARSLIKDGDGAVICVSDHKIDLPADIALLAVGEARDNVGWSGIDVSPDFHWKALVTNHSDHEVTRSWWVAHAASAQPTRNPLTLKPRQSLALSGELPPNVQQATLHLDPDALPVDDQAPMVRPMARPVRTAIRVGGAQGELLRKMVGALDDISFVDAATPADLTLAEIGSEAATDAIFIDSPAPEGSKLDASLVIAENHPLTRELNWMGLITAKPRPLAVLDSDAALLWRGDLALALLRRTATAEGKQVNQLFLNWDLTKSNAERLPAVLVLLHRYVQTVRSQLEGERAENYESAQGIDLPDRIAARPLTLHTGQQQRPFAGTAPEQNGFFEVRSGDAVQVRGATHFADIREADLTKSERFDGTQGHRKEAALRETEADPLTAVWLLAALGCLITAWSSKR